MSSLKLLRHLSIGAGGHKPGFVTPNSLFQLYNLQTLALNFYV